jgi:hypothetical protein
MLAQLLSDAGMSALVNLSEVEVRGAGHDRRYYAETLPAIQKELAASSSLGWLILSDEPGRAQREMLEVVSQTLRGALPGLRTGIVVDHREVPAFADARFLDALCVDIYPFFGPGDPNGPHDAAASQAYLRDTLAQALRSWQGAAPVWVMLQAFAEVWGPRTYDRSYRLLGLPGAYVHWVNPSVSALRWEFWESLRQGVRGVFFYTASAEPPEADMERSAVPDVAWKNALVRASTDAGPSALLNPDLSRTAQIEAAGSLISRALAVADQMVIWQRAAVPVRLLGNGSLGGFRGDGDRRFAVVVNSDLAAVRRIRIEAGEGVSALLDPSATYQVQREPPDPNSPAKGRFQVDLQPGDGVILEVLSVR